MREGALQDAINRLKFERTKAAARSLAELLHEHLPVLPNDIRIVPIPTVRSHIRQRGYDHIELITQYLCQLRDSTPSRLLRRVTNTTQHTSGKAQREAQSKDAFALATDATLGNTIVLLVDDIVTTGATLTAAADLLTRAGATVWVATLAYQPLD